MENIIMKIINPEQEKCVSENGKLRLVILIYHLRLLEETDNFKIIE